MIDRTEQERQERQSFIAQKYNKTKGSNTERHNAHPMHRMMLLKQHSHKRTGCTVLLVRIEQKITEGRDIDT